MAAKGEKSASQGRLPQQESYTLTDLDQLKVLADPLRIRILEALCEERTTMQVAEILGEKPTKLYHHVDALERVGLIELSRTRQNRGTLEKYYLAVARSFRADSRIFHAGGAESAGEEGEALRQALSTILDTTAAELAEIIERGNATKVLESEGILSFLEIRASRRELATIQRKLHDLIESLAASCEGDEGEDPERYRLTIAYYPLDERKRDGERES